MRKWFVCVATVVAVLACVSGAQAQSSLAYSFETIAPSPPNPPGPDGFFGLGATVAQDTIGATVGANSMRYSVGVGGFVGARTEILIPANLNDPPGVKYVTFDFTLTDTYTDTFADFGITLFGHALNKPGGAEFGHQVQFQDQFPFAGLAPGTYKAKIDLDFSLGAYGVGKSFNEIFGPGPDDLTVGSAFQIFISKNVLTPVTVYIDNVRLHVPEPTTMGTVGLGAVVMSAFGWRRRQS